eukprot:scaffold379237_cov38-Prasinocladus_malaysianus.AAC.1
MQPTLQSTSAQLSTSRVDTQLCKSISGPPDPSVSDAQHRTARPPRRFPSAFPAGTTAGRFQS